MLGFVIDEVMKNPAQIVFTRLITSFENDDAFEVFVVV